MPQPSVREFPVVPLPGMALGNVASEPGRQSGRHRVRRWGSGNVRQFPVPVGKVSHSSFVAWRTGGDGGKVVGAQGVRDRVRQVVIVAADDLCRRKAEGGGPRAR